MGGTHSSTVVDDIVNSMLNVISSTAQSAANETECENDIIIGKDCVFKDSNITQSCSSDGLLNAIMTANSSIDISQKMNETIKNASDLVTQNIQTNSVSNDTITKSITNIRSAIQDSIKQSCGQKSDAINIFECEGQFVNSTSNQTAAQKVISNCTMNSSQIISAKQDLQKLIDQHSKTTVKNAIGNILMIIAVIILLVELAPLIVGKGISSSFSGVSSSFTGEQKSNSLRNVIIILITFFVFNFLSYMDCAFNQSFAGIFCKPNKEKEFRNIIITIDVIIIITVSLIMVLKVLGKEKKESTS